MLNRRSALKAAIGGLAAAVWPWKRAAGVAAAPIVIQLPDAIECNGGPIYYPRPCWECGHETSDVVCGKCGFDSGVQPDGSYLVPPRFSGYLDGMVA